MNSRRIFQIIAIASVVVGLLILIAAAAGLVSAIGADPGGAPERWLALLVIAIVAIIAANLLWSGVGHLRRPSSVSALALATNAAIGLWVLLSAALQQAGAQAVIGPAISIVAAALAYLTHRFILKPAALRSFPAGSERSER